MFDNVCFEIDGSVGLLSTIISGHLLVSADAFWISDERPEAGERRVPLQRLT
jgi:hypothetical protein